MSFDFTTPLASLPLGGMGRLVAICGGRGPALRLRRLGLRPGALVRIVAAGWGGPVLVEVEGCRVALGRGLAWHILVEPLGPPPVTRGQGTP